MTKARRDHILNAENMYAVLQHTAFWLYYVDTAQMTLLRETAERLYLCWLRMLQRRYNVPVLVELLVAVVEAVVVELAAPSFHVLPRFTGPDAAGKYNSHITSKTSHVKCNISHSNS